MNTSAAREFVRLSVRARDREMADRVLAEAHAAGASGAEERGDGATPLLVLYARAAHAARVRAAAARVLGRFGSISAVETLAPVDWSRAWRAGMQATIVSERLVIRPSFVSHTPSAGQRELVVDPGTAFGTGEHPSTRLALECIDGLGGLRGASVLDVGTGTGVLAMAALRLGAARAVACDVDAEAARVARRNAERNGLGGRLRVLAGGVDALGGAAFHVVVANLLRTQLVPILPALAAAARADGFVLVSGLLEAERLRVESSMKEAGLRLSAWRCRADANGDQWLAFVTRLPRERASR